MRECIEFIVTYVKLNHAHAHKYFENIIKFSCKKVGGSQEECCCKRRCEIPCSSQEMAVMIASGKNFNDYKIGEICNNEYNGRESNLIASVALLNGNQRALNQSQQTIQVSLNQRFRKLEEDFNKAQEDLTRAQEDAMECTIKRARRECPPEFKNKGHQEQFSFNLEVGDHMDATARKLQKLTPAGEKEK